MKATCKLFLFSIALLACACREKPVHVSKSLYHNHDSLLHYAKLAYLEDPKGLYVTGSAAYLRVQDPMPFDTLGLTTVELDEARIMLLRSAELGYKDAHKLIQCLQKEGCWD